MTSFLARLRTSRLFFFLLGLVLGCLEAPAVLYYIATHTEAEPVEWTEDYTTAKALTGYLAHEGPAARGPRFLVLAGRLGALAYKGEKISEDQFRNMAGPPDVVAEHGDEEALWYNFKDKDGQEGGFLVRVKGGLVYKIGFGGPVKGNGSKGPPSDVPS